MLPGWRYERARTEADFHGQVRILRVEEGVATPGEVRVDADVVRVFRGIGSFPLKSTLSFQVSVLTGEELEIPVGGTLWANYPDLRRADYLEVFLNGNSQECSIALWQVRIIAAPTDEPTVPLVF